MNDTETNGVQQVERQVPVRDERREMFAAFALQGLLAHSADMYEPHELAKSAVALAAALIEELDRGA